MTSKNPVAVLLLLLALSMVEAALLALFADRVWWSFLSLQYGPGPSLGAWFGIALAIDVVRMVGTPDRKGGDVPTAGLVFFGSIWRWSLGAMCLLLALFVGSMAGWAR